MNQLYQSQAAVAVVAAAHLSPAAHVFNCPTDDDDKIQVGPKPPRRERLMVF